MLVHALVGCSFFTCGITGINIVRIYVFVGLWSGSLVTCSRGARVAGESTHLSVYYRIVVFFQGRAPPSTSPPFEIRVHLFVPLTHLLTN